RGRVGPATPDSCLPNPSTASAITNAAGGFTLPLDPGTYQLEFDPPAGAPFPRLTEPKVEVPVPDGLRLTQLPAPSVVDGDVHDAQGNVLPFATVRILEPRCPDIKNCMPPL